jgi:hypothetical protein
MYHLFELLDSEVVRTGLHGLVTQPVEAAVAHPLLAVLLLLLGIADADRKKVNAQIDKINHDVTTYLIDCLLVDLLLTGVLAVLPPSPSIISMALSWSLFVLQMSQHNTPHARQ